MHHTVGYQEAQDTRFSRLNFSKRNIFHFIHFTKTSCRHKRFAQFDQIYFFVSKSHISRY